MRRLLRGLATSSDGVDWQLHHRRCAKMYRNAPVNATERFGSRVKLAHRKAVVTMPAKTEYSHSAHALHGVNYFKMLDDACFFAAQSTNSSNFVVTTSFTTYITRPVVASNEISHLISEGVVTSASKSLVLAEAVMRLPDGTEVGRGSGTFMPHPKFALPSIPMYGDEDEYPFSDEDGVL